MTTQQDALRKALEAADEDLTAFFNGTVGNSRLVILRDVVREALAANQAEPAQEQPVAPKSVQHLLGGQVIKTYQLCTCGKSAPAAPMPSLYEGQTTGDAPSLYLRQTHKLIAREPTEEMLVAVRKKPHPTRPDGWDGTHSNLFRAMWDAAPQATAPVPTDAPTEGYLFEWHDTHGHRKIVSRFDTSDGYRALYEGVTVTELIRRPGKR
jgi:hypothetical protein